MADEQVAPFPDTVTVIEASNGSVVYLVGTAHFSKKSQDDVAQVIKRIKPDVVVMELCSGRLHMLSIDHCTGAIVSGDLMHSIKQLGLVEGMFYQFMITTSATIFRDFGIVPGGELRRALDEAKKCGSGVIFGDRPFVITIKRIISMLSWLKSIKLLAYLLFSEVFKITKEDMKKFKNNDLLETLMLEMVLDDPELEKVMIDERDQFLTSCLQRTAGIKIEKTGSTPSSCSSKPLVVVGVVGLAHVPGIKKYWETVSKQQISELLIIPPPSRRDRIIQTILKVSMCGLLLYGVSRISVVKSLSKIAFSAITRV